MFSVVILRTHEHSTKEPLFVFPKQSSEEKACKHTMLAHCEAAFRALLMQDVAENADEMKNASGKDKEVKNAVHISLLRTDSV